ncbi:MAG: hypothetical protein IBX69_16090 [Anaerolineales bacterium]|nr:hypothetical protein [Anaerolineales bacterium]
MYLVPVHVFAVPGRLVARQRHRPANQIRFWLVHAGLVEIHFPEAEKMRVVLDNLNNH